MLTMMVLFPPSSSQVLGMALARGMTKEGKLVLRQVTHLKRLHCVDIFIGKFSQKEIAVLSHAGKIVYRVKLREKKKTKSHLSGMKIL